MFFSCTWERNGMFNTSSERNMMNLWVGGLWRSRSICCWRSLRTGQTYICEKWPWQGVSCCGVKSKLLLFSRPLPSLKSASCPDMNLHPLSLPLSCLPATAWPHPSVCRNTFASFQQVTDIQFHFSASSFSHSPFFPFPWCLFPLLSLSSFLLPAHIDPLPCSSTWLLVPLFREMRQEMMKVTFHGSSHDKEMDEKSSLSGLFVVAPECLQTWVFTTALVMLG